MRPAYIRAIPPLLVALVLVLIAIPASADLYSAEIAYKKSDFTTAFKQFKELAELGHVLATADGTLGSPDQDALGIRCSTSQVEGRTLSFLGPVAPGSLGGNDRERCRNSDWNLESKQPAPSHVHACRVCHGHQTLADRRILARDVAGG